jgi:GAF domain-containing protein
MSVASTPRFKEADEMASSDTTTMRQERAGVTGAVTADWTPGAEAAPAPSLAEDIDRTLRLTAELGRALVGAHQSAAALIMADDWPHARKWFSLSPKYSDWFAYHAPAVGFGIHALVVEDNKPLRLTQAELEAHPDWRGFGQEAGKHPPMRGWLAVPLIGADGRNYGLLQLSDKYGDAEFTAEDEERLTLLSRLTAITLDSLRAHHEDDRIGRTS